MTLKVDGTNGVLQAYAYEAPSSSPYTYTFPAGVQLLLLAPTGTIASGTVTMPASPVDGMNITITSTQQITALTVNGNTGQSIVGGYNFLSAGGSLTFVYRLSNTTWYSQNNNAVLGANGQVFTTSGTFTVPAGASSIKVTVVGGGGNGGNAVNGAVDAGGGGGGAISIKYITGITPGTAVTVTVGGAAGTSSFGAYCSATGGASAANRTTTGPGPGGAGGTATGGDINIGGGTGGYGYYNGCYGANIGGGGASTTDFAPSYLNSNFGDALIGFFVAYMPASSSFGRGGVGATISGSNGSAAVGYGSGGGGGASNNGTTRTGGAGTGGIVIVEW